VGLVWVCWGLVGGGGGAGWGGGGGVFGGVGCGVFVCGIGERGAPKPPPYKPNETHPTHKLVATPPPPTHTHSQHKPPPPPPQGGCPSLDQLRVAGPSPPFSFFFRKL